MEQTEKKAMTANNNKSEIEWYFSAIMCDEIDASHFKTTSNKAEAFMLELPLFSLSFDFFAFWSFSLLFAHWWRWSRDVIVENRINIWRHFDSHTWCSQALSSTLKFHHVNFASSVSRNYIVRKCCDSLWVRERERAFCHVESFMDAFPDGIE